MTLSKAKGNSFERKIANLLSARFEKITGITASFRRDAGSGSFFGASNAKRMETHDLDNASFGDILTPKNFKFNLECKFYKTPPTFGAIVKGKLALWDSWLDQAGQDSCNAGKKMMLIVKYNGIDEVVFVRDEQPSLNALFLYGDYRIYRLSDFLGLPDEVFFNVEI